METKRKTKKVVKVEKDQVVPMTTTTIEKMLTGYMKPNHYNESYQFDNIQLTKNVINIINNGDMNVIITNNYGPIPEPVVEFGKHQIFEDEEANQLVFEAITGSNSAKAKLIYYYFKDVYKFGEDGNWYRFRYHKWNMLDRTGCELSFATELKLIEICDKLIKHGEQTEMEPREIIEYKKMKKTFGDLKTKKAIMVQVKKCFEAKNNPNNNFVESLNKNQHLIVFNNGVYDLRTFAFRDGLPTDCMSRSVDYDYIDTHTDKFNDLLQFLSDIQPKKQDREAMLVYLSRALFLDSEDCEDREELKRFIIFYGYSGRNGKSKLIDLISRVFGDYYSPISSKLLTKSPPNDQAPDPGLLYVRNKKLVSSAEPEKKNKLNSSFIKFITGREEIKLRIGHSKKMMNFLPQFITILVCNNVPEIDNANMVSKKIKRFNFPVEFCDNPVGQYQKKIDVMIDNNFDSWRGDFMLLLMEYYKDYRCKKTDDK